MGISHTDLVKLLSSPLAAIKAIRPFRRVMMLDASAIDDDVDLVALGDVNLPARSIKVVTAGTGTLVIQYENGTTDTLTGLVDGDEILVEVYAIIDEGTDCTLMRLGF